MNVIFVAIILPFAITLVFGDADKGSLRQDAIAIQAAKNECNYLNEEELYEAITLNFSFVDEMASKRQNSAAKDGLVCYDNFYGAYAPWFIKNLRAPLKDDTAKLSATERIATLVGVCGIARTMVYDETERPKLDDIPIHEKPESTFTFLLLFKIPAIINDIIAKRVTQKAMLTGLAVKETLGGDQYLGDFYSKWADFFFNAYENATQCSLERPEIKERLRSLTVIRGEIERFLHLALAQVLPPYMIPDKYDFNKLLSTVYELLKNNTSITSEVLQNISTNPST